MSGSSLFKAGKAAPATIIGLSNVQTCKALAARQSVAHSVTGTSYQIWLSSNARALAGRNSHNNLLRQACGQLQNFQ